MKFKTGDIVKNDIGDLYRVLDHSLIKHLLCHHDELRLTSENEHLLELATVEDVENQALILSDVAHEMATGSISLNEEGSLLADVPRVPYIEITKEQAEAMMEQMAVVMKSLDQGIPK